ncbi:unnamed protein product [Absidia cylindrospora]
MNPLLWKRLEIYDRTTFLQITTSMAHSHRFLGQHVQFVRLEDFLMSTQFLKLMQHVSRLESLLLDSLPRITDTCFENLPRQYQHLTYLSLHEIPITRRSIVALGEHCPQLSHVSLMDCRKLGFDIFSVFTTWPSLNNLFITHCNLSDASFLNGIYNRPVTEEAALGLVGCHNLKHLIINDDSCDFTRCIATTHDRAGNRTWSNLTSLYLNQCRTLNDAQAIAFIQSHPHLDGLGLIGGTLTDATLDAILVTLPDIKNVHMNYNSGITSDGVRRLIQNCHKLRSVHISGCQILANDFPEVDYDQDSLDGELEEDEWDDESIFLSSLRGGTMAKIRQCNKRALENNGTDIN